jgi:RimJ/RimL family protein N-acetyltransferase
MNEQIEESEEDGCSIRAEKAPLATRRLTLRTPRARDAGAIVPLADNMHIAQQTRRMPHPYSLKDAESWIAAVRNAHPARECAFLIFRNNDGTLMGGAGYAAIEDEDEVELGYWLGEPYWGKGYATEAAQAVIDHAFTEGAFERIHGRCRVTNRASRHVLEKCGFQYSGSSMCACRALNSTMPTEDFILERFVWVSLKRWGANQ